LSIWLLLVVVAAVDLPPTNSFPLVAAQVDIEQALLFLSPQELNTL
jgi:hypothetical protein